MDATSADLEHACIVHTIPENMKYENRNILKLDWICGESMTFEIAC